MKGNRSWRVLLSLTCTLLLLVILSAGLWPFHAPKNAVVWIRGGGVRLGEHGSAITKNPIKHNDSLNAGCSLEIWVKSDGPENDGTILAFFRPDDLAVLFSVRQSLGDLEFKLGSISRHPQPGTRVYADDALRSPEWKFLTLTSGPDGANVYSAGKLIAHRPGFRVASTDCEGKLTIGNAPGIVDSWSGEIRGVAIYKRELSPDEVARNYGIWAHRGERTLPRANDVLALFRFSEGSGSVIHNSVGLSSDLYIPAKFFVLNKPFLEAPWDEFYMGRGYWGNVVLNILAFVPLGLAFYTLFLLLGNIGRPLASTIAVGLIVSLTIEVLQGFLPTRKSGVTDLFTNTLGTALGAICFKWQVIRDLETRIAQSFTGSEQHLTEKGASEGVR